MYLAAKNHFVHFSLQGDKNYYYYSLKFCRPPICSTLQMKMDKYEVKHDVYNSEVSEVSASTF